MAAAIVIPGRRIGIGIKRELAVTIGVLLGALVDGLLNQMGLLCLVVVGRIGLLRGHALLR